MVACVLMVLGLLRLGNLTRLFSHAVLRGFTNAAAITIGLSQMDSLLGFNIPSLDYTFQEVQYIISHLSDTDVPTLVSKHGDGFGQEIDFTLVFSDRLVFYLVQIMGLGSLALLFAFSQSKELISRRSILWSKRLK